MVDIAVSFQFLHWVNRFGAHLAFVGYWCSTTELLCSSTTTSVYLKNKENNTSKNI